MTTTKGYAACMALLERSLQFLWDGVTPITMDEYGREKKYEYVCHSITRARASPSTPTDRWAETVVIHYIEKWLTRHGAVTYNQYLYSNGFAARSDDKEIQRLRCVWVAELVEVFREMRDEAPNAKPTV